MTCDSKVGVSLNHSAAVVEAASHVKVTVNEIINRGYWLLRVFSVCLLYCLWCILNSNTGL